MKPSSASSTPFGHAQSRRRALRLQVSDGAVQLVSAAPFRILALRDISAGGFGIHTDSPVPIGFRWYFEFRAIEGLVITAPARSIHCRRAGNPARGFISGWTFEHSPDLDSALEQLLEAVTPGLIVD